MVPQAMPLWCGFDTLVDLNILGGETPSYLWRTRRIGPSLILYIVICSLSLWQSDYHLGGGDLTAGWKTDSESLEAPFWTQAPSLPVCLEVQV